MSLEYFMGFLVGAVIGATLYFASKKIIRMRRRKKEEDSCC